MNTIVDEMRSDPSPAKMPEFVKALNDNIVAYGATGQRWTKEQRLTMMKRALNGKWNYTLQQFIHAQDPDLKALKTHLLAQARERIGMASTTTLTSAFAAVSLQDHAEFRARLLKH